MPSRFRHRGISSGTRSPSITIVQPAAAWIPPEIISKILGFIIAEDSDVSGIHNATYSMFFIGMTLVCKGWHHPVMSYAYASVSPTCLESCELLVRSLVNNHQLSFLIKSLTIPKDIRIFTIRRLNARSPTIVQELVTKCWKLVELRIPLISSFVWTDRSLRAYLPSMKDLSNLRRLEISAFNTISPFRPRDFAVEYVTMWLTQIPSLPRLESLSLSGVAFCEECTQKSYSWPSMPCLRYLQLDRPYFPSGITTTALFSQIGESLKGLHITGLTGNILHMGLVDRLTIALTISRSVASSLEELALTSPLPAPGYQDPDTVVDLRHMLSVRSLKISHWLFHPERMPKLPPCLETLIITDCDAYSTLDVRKLLKRLPPSVRNLTIKVTGQAWDTPDRFPFDRAGKSRIYPKNVVKAGKFTQDVYRLADELGIKFDMVNDDGMHASSTVINLFALTTRYRLIPLLARVLNRLQWLSLSHR
jgi:hypothetical protein